MASRTTSACPTRSCGWCLIAATVFGGFGVLIYAALWFLMPLGTPTVPAAPGLAAHTRGGLRTDQPPPQPVTEAKERKREKSRGQVTALVVVGVGVLLLLQVAGLGIAGKMFWPLVFAGTGLALIWRQADESQKAAVGQRRSRPDPRHRCSARAAGSR